jgi:hypothetical protein
MSDCSGAVKGDRVAVPADGSFPHTPPQNLPVSFRPLIALNAPLVLAVTVDSRVGAPVPYLSWTDTGARADFVL